MLLSLDLFFSLSVLRSHEDIAHFFHAYSSALEHLQSNDVRLSTALKIFISGLQSPLIFLFCFDCFFSGIPNHQNF
jgi:hypothetical protein